MIKAWFFGFLFCIFLLLIIDVSYAFIVPMFFLFWFNHSGYDEIGNVVMKVKDK